MKHFRLALLVFASALGLARAQDEQSRQPPTEIPDFSNLDEYIYEPKSTLIVGTRFLSGAKTQFFGKGTLAANDDRPGFEGHLEFVRRDAGKGDAERQTIRRLVQVDGRLPARCPRGTDLEEPALQLLCPTKQLQRFGPHP